jgi:hypothetical protein
MEKKASAEKAVREIRRKTRRRFTAEEKIRIVIEGLRGEDERGEGDGEDRELRVRKREPNQLLHGFYEGLGRSPYFWAR